MAGKQRKKSIQVPEEVPPKGKVWKRVMLHLASRGGDSFSVDDIATELEMERPATLAILRRLREWGNIHVVDHADPIRIGRHAGGRKRLLFNLTGKGFDKAKFISENE